MAKRTPRSRVESSAYAGVEPSVAVPDVMPELKRARDAAARGDARATLESLLQAWRLLPATELAEAIDGVTTTALAAAPASDSFEEAAKGRDLLLAGALVDRLREVNASAATARVALLKPWPADPRLAAGIVRLLQDPPFHATGSQPFWTIVYQLLDASPDPRQLASLAKLPGALESIIHGASMRGWMQKKIDKASTALRERFPEAPALPDEARPLLDAIRGAALTPTPAARPASGVSEAELWRLVYASPEDDGPRAVLADVLSERGDPRGEFITLQLARGQRELTPEEQKLEAALLRKHQSAWLGEVASILRYRNYPRFGLERPDDRYPTLFIRWHRGFLYACILTFTLPKLKKLASAPEWSTVEHVRGLRVEDERWRAPASELLAGMRSLRRLGRVSVELLRVIVDHPALVARLERLDDLYLKTASEVAEHLPLLLEMPRLRSLQISTDAGGEQALATSPLPRKLEHLWLNDGRDLAVR
jgi:uncharacterized protein (TIGR02996 family)